MDVRDDTRTGSIVFNLVRWGTYLTVMKEYFQKNFPEKVKNVTEERLYFPCPEHDSLINPNL
mgnify:CR=1 FL=1